MSTTRTVLFGAGALLILGVAGIVVAGAALDPVRLEGELKDGVLRATGRELSVAGGVHLKLGLSPRFEVDDVAFANMAGGSRPQMLTASSLTAHLALIPLLGGDAVISSLSLRNPDILLERAPDGTGNWQFSTTRKAALYQGHGGQSSAGGHGVRVREIHLDGGQLHWLAGPGSAVTLGIGALQWSADSPDTPMALSFRGTRGEVPIEIKASTGSLQRLQGGPVSALSGAWPVMIDALAAGGTLHVEGGVNHPEQARGYTLRLTANAATLATLSPLLGMGALPPLVDVNATAVLQDGGAGEMRTSQISIHAGASDLGPWVAGLTIRQLALSAPGPGQLAQLSLDGTYQATPLSVAGTVMQPDVVGAGGPVQVTFSAQAAGANLAARGTLPPNLNAPGIDLSVQGRAADVSALSPLIGRTLPPAHDLTLSANLGDAGVKLRGVVVRDLSIASSLGDVSGQVTAQWAPRASIVGELTSRVLNFDAIAGTEAGLLPAVWPPAAQSSQGAVQLPPPEAPAVPPPSPAVLPTSVAASAGTLPLAQMRRTDADLSLTIGDLTAGGQRVQDLQAHLRLQDGKLALNPFRAISPEGAIIGGASLDATSDDPPIAITLRSPSIAADAVAGLLGFPRGAHGTMQVDAQLSGTGQTLPALTATLSGHVGLAMVNGQIEDAMVQGLVGEVLNTAGVPTFGGGTSQVRCFAGRVDFDAGIGTIRVLSADTSRLVLEADGTLDLKAQSAALHLRPRVRLGPTAVAAPVSLAGPFGQMKATLDPVLSGGRVGVTIGGPVTSACAAKLAIARGGLGGPLPAMAPPDQGLTIRKPKDLLQGLFH